MDRPASVPPVLNYIRNLHARVLSAVSIRSKLSAIYFWHQLHGKMNPTDQFLVKKALIGASNLKALAPIIKVPASLHLLLSIVSVLSAIELTQFQRTLFHSVFTLAFIAFLWVGEYTFLVTCYRGTIFHSPMMQSISLFLCTSFPCIE